MTIPTNEVLLLLRPIGCLVVLSAVLFSSAAAQNERRLTDSVNIYTLARHVQTLAAAGGHPSRVKFTPGGDSAAAYIKRELEGTPGLASVAVDTFFNIAKVPFNSRPLFNVVAKLQGTGSPESLFVIGAHYDCSASRQAGGVWNSTWQTISAPGADDNATGVAIMLEAARIMADPAGGFRPRHSILFAAYGSEESGPADSTGTLSHAGSRFHSGRLNSAGSRISGMVSVDMVGYNKSYLFTSIITNTGSRWLADVFRESIARNAIGLYDSIAVNAGATYSDHDRFWAYGYPAVCLMEYAPPWNNGTYYRANPLYHTSADSFGSVNMNLVRRVGQMTVASVARVTGDILTNVSPAIAGSVPESPVLLQNYPNPFNPSTTIPFRLSVRTDVRLAVYDLLGRETAVLYEGMAEAGDHAIRFDGSGIASGLYFVRLVAGEAVRVRPLTLLR